MKLLALTLTILSFPLLAQPPTPRKLAKAGQLLELTNANASVDQMMDQGLRMATANLPADLPSEVRAQMEESNKKTMAFIREHMSWQNIKPKIVQIYAEVYTEQELDGMIAFYLSPVGKSMLSKTPAIMQRTMALTQETMAELMPELMRITKESLPK